MGLLVAVVVASGLGLIAGAGSGTRRAADPGQARRQPAALDRDVERPDPPLPSPVDPSRDGDSIAAGQAAGALDTRSSAVLFGEDRGAAVPPRSARLFVNAEPWGRVAVDGRDIGETPVLGLRIRPGRHRIRVTSQGLAPRLRVVTMRPGEELRVFIGPPGAGGGP
jgi:hypothetical protein